jgi:hypothetical protein
MQLINCSFTNMSYIKLKSPYIYTSEIHVGELIFDKHPERCRHIIQATYTAAA